MGVMKNGRFLLNEGQTEAYLGGQRGLGWML